MLNSRARVTRFEERTRRTEKNHRGKPSRKTTGRENQVTSASHSLRGKARMSTEGDEELIAADGMDIDQSGSGSDGWTSASDLDEDSSDDSGSESVFFF